MSNDSGAQAYKVIQLRPDGSEGLDRPLPVETPVALEYNGIAYAVMMATPHDLIDYATGFSLSEGVASTPADIIDVACTNSKDGVLVKIRVVADCMQQVVARVRNRVSEGSCGLCGLESLAEVNRPLPRLTSRLSTSVAVLFSALEKLRAFQPLNALTGGVHAAAFCNPSNGDILLAREDVGRHNALDKLIGALARSNTPPESGFVFVSSRCSYELVEKTVNWGCPLLVSISTATSLAVDRAEDCGLGLVALARSDAMLAMTSHAQIQLTNTDD